MTHACTRNSQHFAREDASHAVREQFDRARGGGEAARRRKMPQESIGRAGELLMRTVRRRTGATEALAAEVESSLRAEKTGRHLTTLRVQDCTRNLWSCTRPGTIRTGGRSNQGEFNERTSYSMRACMDRSGKQSVLQREQEQNQSPNSQSGECIHALGPRSLLQLIFQRSGDLYWVTALCSSNPVPPMHQWSPLITTELAIALVHTQWSDPAESEVSALRTTHQHLYARSAYPQCPVITLGRPASW